MGDRRRLKVVEMTLQELMERVNSLEHQTGLTKEGWPREPVREEPSLAVSQVIEAEEEEEEQEEDKGKEEEAEPKKKSRGRKKK